MGQPALAMIKPNCRDEVNRSLGGLFAFRSGGPRQDQSELADHTVTQVYRLDRGLVAEMGIRE